MSSASFRRFALFPSSLSTTAFAPSLPPFSRCSSRPALPFEGDEALAVPTALEPIDTVVEPEGCAFRPPPRPETTGGGGGGGGCASSDPLADDSEEESESSDPEELDEDEVRTGESTRALPVPVRAAAAATVRGCSLAPPSLLAPRLLCLGEPLMLFDLAGFRRGLARGLRAFAFMPNDVSSSSSSSEAADPDSLVLTLGVFLPTLKCLVRSR